MGQIIQYSIAGILGIGAIFYLFIYFRKSLNTKHDCPDCGVAEVKNKTIK